MFESLGELVDLKSLSEYLVKSLGSQTLVDPLTQEDALWSLIEFFTREGIYHLSHQTDLTIDPNTIADYLGSHLKAKSSFDKSTKVALRLNS